MSIAPLPTLPTVICHTLPPAERQATVLATFDGLCATESFLLVSDHPQSPVLALLQRERPGLFEWSPLEEGPETWRTAVTRRPAADAERAVTEALSWDHDRLDDLERGAFARRAAGDLAGAAETFALFAHGLRRHIGFEEAILFKEFELRSGVAPHQGPTAVLRAEHREIEGLLVEIESCIATSGSAVEPLRERLHRVLGDHNDKEEMVLYPGTDRLLSAGERDALVGRIQAFTG
jgi:uncharacterized protein (DUF2249 family)